MTKADLVAVVTQASGHPKAKVAVTLDLLLALITEALLNHQRVELRRFGTFEVTYRRSRVARDLNTNDELRLPARPMPRFVPFDALKDVVKGTETMEGTAERDEVAVLAERSSSPVPDVSLPMSNETQPDSSTPEHSLNALIEAVNTNPDDLDARLSLAIAYTEQQMYDEAIEQCQVILHQNPVHLSAILQLGLIQETQGKYERAMEEYERVLRIDRDHVEATQRLGMLHSKLGLYVEAESEFKRALELNPSSVETYYHLGVVHTKRGLYGRAIQEFEKVLELDAQHIDAYFHLGRAYDHQERYDDAIQMFEALLKVQPENSRAYWHLGILYDKKKAGAKALEMYQRANLLSATRKKNERR